ncbi:uncharacterized protein KY384_008595 [Bacidia gigantensis]|uniref:uncharacterized protein n=1 Tax=Bacidia gigantensis TaxID=2732470 RepID=UPI001D03B4E6|nr:uncharacterized protein KY384_008595 [Bacidia gigantensis]KAG8527165.1 hypothetical protein KY384_008595 [Bacidia gigantensis]
MQIASLFILFIANSVTLFGVGILLIRNIWSIGANVTTIEGWEIERHETLVSRAKKQGGLIYGPNGKQIRLSQQEFPYDIGIMKNVAQSMGRNPLFWLFPLGPTPSNESGLSFETNGFDDRPWPPPDPDRISKRVVLPSSEAFTRDENEHNAEQRVTAFRKRQQADSRRLENGANVSKRATDTRKGSTWKDSNGERLDDFGVDEASDFDEDDIPLRELLRRRTGHASSPP